MASVRNFQDTEEMQIEEIVHDCTLTCFYLKAPDACWELDCCRNKKDL